MRAMDLKRNNENGSHHAATQLISHCQLCHSLYKPAEVSLIEEEGPAQLLHVRCSHCASAMVLLLLISEHGMGSVGLITDLTQSDVLRFTALADTISANDVLGVHQLLNSDFIATI